ncbi:LysE family translocator [Musicola keenii]|uniref:LysE family translocator n=1 Tax=Musicola keenii TaxID=2884250 RepID=UPI00177F2E94|nr:LysE family transporter [Musicola keenii]
MSSLLFPEHFAALAAAHFAALLSPGADFFLILAYAIRHRLRGSAGICLGIAAGNAVYIALASLGWQGLRPDGGLFIALELAGACYLTFIGIKLLRAPVMASLPSQGESAPCPGFGRQCLMGFGSALLNPKNMLFYISLMASILGPVSAGQQWLVGGWMFLAVLLWDLLVAALVGWHPLQQRLRPLLFGLTRLSGAILLLFGLALLFNRALACLG